MQNDLLVQALYELVNCKTIKVKRDEKAKKFPLLAVKKDGDVGYDLYCTEDMLIQPGKRRTVSTGVSIEMPNHIWATIEPRSSASKWNYDELKCACGMRSDEYPCDDNGVNIDNINGEATEPKFNVITGIIDTGYRGELKAVLINVGCVPVEIKAGERYAQVIFHLRVTPPIEEVDELAASERGETGFGSSGK